MIWKPTNQSGFILIAIVIIGLILLLVILLAMPAYYDQVYSQWYGR